MKTILAMIITLGLLSLFSCNRADKMVQQTTLAGKMYRSSDGMDSLCKYIPRETDYYQTFLFINDSQFVQIVNTCCADLEEDFAYQYVIRNPIAELL